MSIYELLIPFKLDQGTDHDHDVELEPSFEQLVLDLACDALRINASLASRRSSPVRAQRAAHREPDVAVEPLLLIMAALIILLL